MATFAARKWALATFLDSSLKIVPIWARCTDGFGQKKWVFGRFYFKNDQRETVEPQGFAGFVATFPLFSLFNVKKKFVNYI